MKRTTFALALALAAGFSGAVLAQAKEQFVPANFYWVGPYAPGGSGFGGGIIDYMQMLNERDGGINGVKLTWEKCETEYNNARGVECYERSKNKGPTGATVIHPLSTGITYSLIEKATTDRIPIISMGYGRASAADGRVFPYVFPLITTYWSQASSMVNFLGNRAGGMDKLKGKKIVLLYHDSAYGKEPIPILTDLSKDFGYQLTTIAVPHPGNEQQAQWLQIRQLQPDWVILWGWGVMNPTAIKTAARTGYPREKMVGVWWSGAEEDVIPAGSAAKGYISAGFNLPGSNFPVMRDIQKYVYAKGKGEFDDKSRFGSIYHTRGVVAGIVTTEAIRAAQAKFGKGKSITGEQMQWGIENLKIDEKRLKELGAVGLMPPIEVSCFNHEGSGLVKYQQWDGSKWIPITDWVEPDYKLVRAKVEADAAQYAKEKGITPRDCPKGG
ncbi:MAG TPA: ABC transporter substrate-binding protein [Burkholderiales bacterium]|nr:ABC transporter substrate-binding protein [Burkholderiales bacterium]